MNRYLLLMGLAVLCLSNESENSRPSADPHDARTGQPSAQLVLHVEVERRQENRSLWPMRACTWRNSPRLRVITTIRKATRMQQQTHQDVTVSLVPDKEYVVHVEAAVMRSFDACSRPSMPSEISGSHGPEQQQRAFPSPVQLKPPWVTRQMGRPIR